MILDGYRALSGVGAAALVAGAAYLAGSLSGSGALAAALVGGIAVAAGWSWGSLLVIYFVTSSLLTRLGAERKSRRTASVVAKGGRRDAVQVLANGGLFAAGTLALVLGAAPAGPVAVATLGALAAATADTWATEIGVAASGAPRSLLTLRPVPPGTSGGVSLAGTLAMLGGALFIAVVARLLGLPAALLAVAAGGTAGALADSLLGATLQARRWCATCERFTEREVHDCGRPTVHAAGLAWLNNDAVNFAATLAGAVVAVLPALLRTPS